MPGAYRVNQVCELADVTRKTLRGYEELGLVRPRRDANNYRVYDEHQVAVVGEIRRLARLDVPLAAMRPFVDCMDAGSEHADSCPASLAGYRRAIERIDERVESLTTSRAALVARLTDASARLLATTGPMDAANPRLVLPGDLPAPVDDGAADRLRGRRLPDLRLASTDGTELDLRDLDRGRVLLYVFPMTGSPGQDMPVGWDTIPGARGCTAENCDFRNHYAELVQHGIDRVYGLSSQPAAYQRALVENVHLPYPLLTDEQLHLADDPGLPTFEAAGLRLYSRQTLLLRDGVVEHVFYPVFPPDRHAEEVLTWLTPRNAER